MSDRAERLEWEAMDSDHAEPPPPPTLAEVRAKGPCPICCHVGECFHRVQARRAGSDIDGAIVCRSCGQQWDLTYEHRCGEIVRFSYGATS